MTLIERQESMSNNIKQLEDLLLQEIDIRTDNAPNQTEKLILELFKSAILKKYKESYVIQVLHGEVKEETLDKCLDYLFTEACVKYRLLPGIDDTTKETEIKAGKNSLDSLKKIVTKMLADKGVVIK